MATEPESFAPDDEDELPPSFKTVVREHERSPRRKPQDASLEAQGLAGAAEVRSQVVGRLGATLPGLGGLGGGLVAGIPGATIGGMVGKAGQMGLRGLKGVSGIRPSDPEAAAQAADALMEIGKAGVQQGALQAAGRGIAKGVGLVGKGLVMAALKANPRVAQTIMDKGLTATPWGMAKLKNKLVQSAASTANLTSAATKSGTVFNPVQLAREIFQDLGPSVTNQAIPVPAQTTLRKMTSGFLAANPASKITPDKLLKLKQRSDMLLANYYKKEGYKPVEALPTNLQWHFHFANRARTMLEQIPGVAASNAETKALIEAQGRLFPGSRNILARLLSASAPPAVGAAIGATVPGDRRINALAGAALFTPAVASQLSVGANSPILATLLRNAPNALSMLAAEPDTAAVQ